MTDNGNHILDVRGLEIVDPVALESEINQIAGVVTVGLFARRPADVLLVGTRRWCRNVDGVTLDPRFIRELRASLSDAMCSRAATRASPSNAMR